MEEILELGRSRLKVKITTLMLMDSLEMTDGDRLKILDYCKSADENQIVITNSTDTMTKTCNVLANAKLKKIIVLTGAMIPYKVGSSDGLFNIGVYLRKAYPDSWESEILTYNMEFLEPPLPLNEVNIVPKQLERKDYAYKS